jgi:PIN domain
VSNVAAVAPRRIYLDTSAYLALLLDEEGADRLAQIVAGATLLSSVLLILESRRNLIRLTRAGTLKPSQYDACVNRIDEDIRRFELRDLTLDLCTSNALPPIATPRSLDLAHLRTALWFHAQSPIHRFLTMDAAQAQAARELGLPVQ